MIKKLRIKFILINMTLVSVVLLIVFAAIFISTHQRLQIESHESLKKAIDQRERKSTMAGDFPKEMNHAPLPFSPVACVLLNEDGSIASILENRASFTEEVLNEAVQQVNEQTESEGILHESNVRFLKRETPEGVKIAFSDRSNEISTLKGLLLTSVFVGIGGLAAFFLISLFLSTLTLRPVEQAWKQQRQFVADASHELKTPLTVILANLEILLAHQTSTIFQYLKWIDSTQEEAERMKGLVNDLLFLAKSDAGRSQPEMYPLNFSDTLLNCLLTFEAVAFENGVTIDSQIEPDIYIKGNENQIKQLVMILLDNACKYAEVPTASASKTVTAKLTITRTFAYFSLNNPSPPIAKEDLAHIFERFYRSDKARAHEHRGYGLGLSIAHKIVEIHHGNISVSSIPEQGTTFTIRFPVFENG